MIPRKWKDPNFKFCAKDGDGVVKEYFCYAESEEALKGRLKSQFDEVEWIAPYDFKEWKDRAEKATLKVIASHDKAIQKNPAEKPLINFKPEIWSELKYHLFELFDGKCAYCECKPRTASSGDVEHFRPKAKIDEDSTHHGYYWLAFNYMNLLPSCPDCNRSGAGKMNRFPVAGNIYARDPQDLTPEDPLLLNPYNEGPLDPSLHLEFDTNGAALAYENSLYGEASRKCYHLNRFALCESRREALQKFRRDWSTLAGIIASQDIAEEALRKEIQLGQREYSAAQLWELERLTNRHRPHRPGFGAPLAAGPSGNP
jgi:uncharacterized protein (TIGR02646 family)